MFLLAYKVKNSIYHSFLFLFSFMNIVILASFPHSFFRSTVQDLTGLLVCSTFWITKHCSGSIPYFTDKETKVHSSLANCPRAYRKCSSRDDLECPKGSLVQESFLHWPLFFPLLYFSHYLHNFLIEKSWLISVHFSSVLAIWFLFYLHLLSVTFYSNFSIFMYPMPESI